MRGRLPKPPALRRRRNRVTTQAQLTTEGPARKRAPALPDERLWHPMTRRWWKDVWHSPMADEFVRADLHGLYRLAVLVDSFWVQPSKDLAAEIRLQQAAYGLTPIDRRRLQWEITRTERSQRRPQQPDVPRDDPRAALRAVK